MQLTEKVFEEICSGVSNFCRALGYELLWFACCCFVKPLVLGTCCIVLVIVTLSRCFPVSFTCVVLVVRLLETRRAAELPVKITRSEPTHKELATLSTFHLSGLECQKNISLCRCFASLCRCFASLCFLLFGIHSTFCCLVHRLLKRFYECGSSSVILRPPAPRYFVAVY